MSRQEIMEKVASYFDIEPNDEGEFDINDYEWQAGSYNSKGKWISLAELVYCIEYEFDF